MDKKQIVKQAFVKNAKPISAEDMAKLDPYPHQWNPKKIYDIFTGKSIPQWGETDESKRLITTMEDLIKNPVIDPETGKTKYSPVRLKTEKPRVQSRIDEMKSDYLLHEHKAKGSIKVPALVYGLSAAALGLGGYAAYK